MGWLRGSAELLVLPAQIINASIEAPFCEIMAMHIPIPIKVESASLQDRVQRLEGTVLLLLEVVQSLVQCVDSKLGPGAVDDRLRSFACIASEADAVAVAEEIDREIRSGNNPGAVRKVRDEVGCTWDHAREFVGQWQSMPGKQRIRVFRLGKMMRCLEAASQQAQASATRP